MIALWLALDLAAVAPGGAGCAIMGAEAPAQVLVPGEHQVSLTIAAAHLRALRPGGAGDEPLAEVDGPLRFRGRLYGGPSPRFRFRLTRAIESGGLRIAAGAYADQLEARGGERARASVRLPGGVEVEGLELPCGALAFARPFESTSEYEPDVQLYLRKEPGGERLPTVVVTEERALRVVERRDGWKRVRLRAGATVIEGWLPDPGEPTRLLGRVGYLPSLCMGMAFLQPPRERRARIARGTPVRDQPNGRVWATIGDGVVARVRIVDGWAQILELPGVDGCVDNVAWVHPSSLSDP